MSAPSSSAGHRAGATSDDKHRLLHMDPARPIRVAETLVNVKALRDRSFWWLFVCGILSAVIVAAMIPATTVNVSQQSAAAGGGGGGSSFRTIVSALLLSVSGPLVAFSAIYFSWDFARHVFCGTSSSSCRTPSASSKMRKKDQRSDEEHHAAEGGSEVLVAPPHENDVVAEGVGLEVV